MAKRGRTPEDKRARINQHIAERVRIATKEKGWSLRQVARRMGYSPTTIHDHVTGVRAISWERVEEFARALDKPVEWFLPRFYLDSSKLDSRLNEMVEKINRLKGDRRERVIDTLYRVTMTLVEE